MKPFIDQAFWSDSDVESCDANIKLAALWLITNSQTSLLGICASSVARFRFETGLPADALNEVIRRLPTSFVKIGSSIFVRNYIRHQFGSGEKLTRNNFFKALKSLFLSIKDEALREEVLSEYPEFKQALSEGYERASQAQGKERIGKDRKGNEGGAGGNEDPVPGELLTQDQAVQQAFTAGVPEDFARYVYDDWHSRDGKDGGGAKVRYSGYVKKRWTREQAEWESGAHKGKKKSSKSTEAERDTARTGIPAKTLNIPRL